MRKIIVCSALLINMVACNSNSSSSNKAAGDTTQNTGLTNPSSVDTTKHPDGVVNVTVISTDTAAINVQNSVNKGKELKANISIDEVKKEMYGKNSEVLVRVFGEERFTEDEMNSLSIEKEKRYQKAFLPELKLINGLNNFLEEAESKQIKMAIASAA